MPTSRRRISRIMRLGTLRVMQTHDQQLFDRFVGKNRKNMVAEGGLRQIKEGETPVTGNRATAMARRENGKKKAVIYWKPPAGKKEESVRKAHAVGHELFHLFQHTYPEQFGVQLNINSALGRMSEALFLIPGTLYIHKLGKKRKNTILAQPTDEQLVDVMNWRSIHNIRKYFPTNQNLYDALEAALQDSHVRQSIDYLNTIQLNAETRSKIRPHYQRIIQFLLAHAKSH